MKGSAAFLAVGLLASACWFGRTDGGEQPPTTPIAAVAVPADLGQRAYEHVARLVAFGPRHTGSKGWKSAVEYVGSELVKLGLTPNFDTWVDPNENMQFTNVSTTIPGRRPERIVIGCHHDTKNTTGHSHAAHNFEFVGANDSGSGVAALLALASELRDRRCESTIELVFFDGEESIPFDWDITRALFGSRHYVEEHKRRILSGSDEAPIRAFVLLDMVGAKDLQIDRESKSDPRLQTIVFRAAKACGHEALFFRNELAVTDDHVPFLDAGIPAIDLIDIYDNPEWHTPDDTLDTISAESLHKVLEVVLTALPEIERQFVLERPRLVLPPEPK